MDQSNLDTKYFVDNKTYNCPFCNRRNVVYLPVNFIHFDWTNEKPCYSVMIQCSSCHKTSLHHSFKPLREKNTHALRADEDLDGIIFHSIPTSFFTLDARIPQNLRTLISESEGSLKMNFLTGASACARKAIYEMLHLEKAEGDHYDERIRNMKTIHPEVDPSYFDILSDLQDMTSENLHEASWEKWDSKHIKLIIETLKLIFRDMYVLPEERKLNRQKIQALKSAVKTK